MPATSEAATETLLDDYNEQDNPLVRSDTLRGLGNAGSTESIALVSKAAQSGNASERAASAQALRKVPSDAADRLLAQLMDDADPFVRRNALDAALYRDPTEILVPVVQRLARLDPEATVRREAIRVLVRWKDQVSSARETLVWVSKNDPEDDLRAVALEGLSRPA
jgi:HEAT repeat protein